MKKILLIFYLLIPFMNFAQSTVISQQDSIYVFKEGWKFSSDDDSSMARVDYDDSKWQVTSSRFRNSDNKTDLFHGLGWFRYHFYVDTGLVNFPMAFVMEQTGASQIYLDGKRIINYGIINGKDSSVYYDPLRIPELVYFNSAGSHVIAIRYANYKTDENFNSGFYFSLGNAKDRFEQKQINGVAITFLSIALGFIFLTLCVLHLFFFLYYPDIKSNLFFSIFMFSVAALFFIMFIGSLAHNREFIMTLQKYSGFFTCLTCLSFTFFIHTLFNKKTKFWTWFISFLAILSLAAQFFSTDYYESVILTLIITTSFYGIFSIIASLVKKVKGAWIVGTGILFFILFLLTIIAFSIAKGQFELNDSTLLGKILILTCILAIVSIPLSMSVYQAWGFAQLNKDLIKQLIQVQQLSDKTIKQEQEKKQILENQKAELEIKVEERTQQLKAEKQKSDDLLLNILPEEVAEELKNKGSADAKHFDDVTVMFTDFKGFTQISEKLSPSELVAEIHTCFKAFDNIISNHNIEKIKTIGDSYMCVGGLPVANTTNAIDVVSAAIEIQQFMQQHLKQRRLENKEPFEIRIGIHTGPVVAGIVGVKKFAYDIWGDTVNIASRMESSGEPGKINISGSTYSLVKEKFNCIHRGKISAKNKGEIDMYFVEE